MNSGTIERNLKRQLVYGQLRVTTHYNGPIASFLLTSFNNWAHIMCGHVQFLIHFYLFLALYRKDKKIKLARNENRSVSSGIDCPTVPLIS